MTLSVVIVSFVMISITAENIYGDVYVYISRYGKPIDTRSSARKKASLPPPKKKKERIKDS